MQRVSIITVVDAKHVLQHVHEEKPEGDIEPDQLVDLGTGSPGISIFFFFPNFSKYFQKFSVLAGGASPSRPHPKRSYLAFDRGGQMGPP